jgi:hypothetical protein
VSNNSVQIAQLVERVWAKTRENILKWEQGNEPTKFVTRLGDYAITLNGSGNSVFPSMSSVRMIVQKLDGKTIADISVGGTMASVSSTLGNVDSTTEAHLRTLYKFVSSRNTELDDLLKLLR